MSLADLVVVKVVSRRDFEATGPELPVHIIIGNDRYLSSRQRQLNLFANQVAVPVIVRVNRDGGVTQHGLGPGCRHHEVAASRSQRVAQVPEMALLLFGNDLQVRNRGVQGGIPVHQALAAVDQPLVVQPNEDFLYRKGQAGVHGETLPGPVHGGSQTP